MITENEVEKALEWLRDHAEEAAEERAERLHMEEYRKSLKALIMREHLDKAVNAQEREAYADARYIEHLEAMKTAIFEDEKGRFLREAASDKISAWQTFSANSRPKI